MKKTTHLLHCPFCGSFNVDPEGWASIDDKGPACDDCGASARSVEIWNRRSGPTGPTNSLRALAARVAAGEVKALSIKQPYPHHIFHDGKDVENRDWPTQGRGWFIIHAGVSTTELEEGQLALPRGGVVGMARIVDCVEEMESEWFFGKYGFVLEDAFPLPLIPCKGALSFFKLPPDICTAVSEAILALPEAAQ